MSLFDLEPESAPERPRDYAYEALAEVCGLDMDADRGRLNAGLGEIREREPELSDRAESFLLADLIHARARIYRDVMGDVMLTPVALAKHWDALPVEQEAQRKTQVVQTNVAVQVECETCGGDRMVVYSLRPPVGLGVEGHIHTYEEMAPCPACNSGADAGFWRADGSRFSPPDPAQVRRRIG